MNTENVINNAYSIFTTGFKDHPKRFEAEAYSLTDMGMYQTLRINSTTLMT